MLQIDFLTYALFKKVSSMRLTAISGLFCSVALVASLAFTASPQLAHAKSNEAEKPAKEVTFNPKSVGTFAGAFLAARTADIDRDYATAIPLYRKALEFDPANTDIRQRLMIANLLNGEFEDGVKLAEGLKADPVVERVTTIVRALSAIKAKKYKQAREALIYKGDNDLDKMVNTFLTAWADFGAGEKTKALTDIEKMQGPAWISIFQKYNAGNLALLSGKTDIARKHFLAAVTDREGGATASDTYMRAIFALATLEANAGNKQKALDVIAKGDEFAPNYAPLKALSEQINKGGKLPQQVNNAAEGAASVMFSIAAALNREGAEEIVTLYLQTSRALDPKSADVLIMLGGLAESLEKPQLAIEYYRQVPVKSPMHRISQLQLGLTLAQTDKSTESRKHLKALLDADPSDIRSYLAYGSVLSDAKEYREMAKVYDKAIEVIGEVPKRNDWTVFFQRAIAYERLKEWDKAEPNFKKALALNPDQPQVLNYLGYSWVDRNQNLEEAMKMIERAVELRPNDGYIVDSLGWAHYRLGEFDKAVSELERAVELRAGDPTINDHLGDAYWRVGRKIEAVYQWNRALIGESDDVDKGVVQQKIENGLPELTQDGKPPMAAEGKQDEKKL
jgi:tetratricopeptide (TPR) repeat protein